MPAYSKCGERETDRTTDRERARESLRVGRETESIAYHLNTRGESIMVGPKLF